jgi:hypothetical protein
MRRVGLLLTLMSVVLVGTVAFQPSPITVAYARDVEQNAVAV